MRESLRKSGIDIVGDVPWGTHFCHFYQTKEDLVDILIPYFKAGVEKNEFCLWVISKPLDFEDAVAALTRAIPDLNTYLEKGQIAIIPRACWCLKEDIFYSEKALSNLVGKIKHALDSGYDGLRFSEDRSWLGKEGWNRFIEYEKQINNVIDNYQTIALCSYSLNKCNETEIIDVVANHQFSLVKKEGEWKRIDNSGREKAEKAIQAKKNLDNAFDAVRDSSESQYQARTGEAMCARENQYRFLYENSLDGILLTKPDGTILSANPEACHMFGMTEDEIKRVGREGVVVNNEKLAAALEERKWLGQFRAELAHKRKDGSTFICDTTSKTFVDADGSISTSLIIRDITERKQAEESLRESEQRYRTLFNSMDEGFCVIEILFDENEKPTDYIFVETNPAFERNTGLKNAAGKRIKELVPENEEYWYEIYGRVALTGESVRFENRVKSLNRWYEVYAFRIGQPERRKVAVLFNDITERKQEMQRILRYNSVLEGINRIFSNVVQDKTEEELANACLSVALEVTGSPIGFVGEIGEDGLFHDLAISENGWNQCLMYDRTGHRRPPGNFFLHGLYGHVVYSGRSFFTNDPQSDPNSTGLPDGHPLIMSFLGVPLVLDGKTLGMIGVANREGGYSHEQREDLEAIAPSIMQILQRKKAYQRRKLAEEALLESEKMLKMALKAARMVAWNWNSEKDQLNISDNYPEIYGCNDINQERDGFALIYPEDLDRHRSIVKKALQEGGTYISEFRIIRPDTGAIAWREERAEVLKDEVGKTKLFGVTMDITERKLADETLQRERSLLESVMQTTDVMLVFLDPQFNFAWVNPAYAETCQMKPEDIVGKNHFTLYPNAENEAIFRHVRDTGEGIFYKDKPFVFPDQPKRGVTYWDWSLAPVKDSGGNVTGLVFSLHETTKNKQAEEALRESESRLRLAQVSAGAGIWDWDMSTDKLEWSEELFQLFGLDPRKTDASFDAWRSVLHPDDRLIAEKRIETAINNRISLASEYRIVLPSGEDRWINALGNTTYDSCGKPQLMSGICIDITERKKAEEALRLSNIYNRSLIESSLDPLVTIGRDGRIKDVNVATEQVTGYSRKDLIGTDFSDYFTEPEKAREGYQKVFTEGKVRDYSLEIHHKEGHITPVLYNASVYRDEHGEVIGVFAAARDIAELKKAEEALKKAHDNLENLVKERTAELEQAYRSLKESEEGLAEAQRMVHIGNWRWNIVTNELFWSDEVYRIFGLNTQETRVTYDLFLNFVHPNDRDYLINAINEGLKGNPCAVDYRIILDNGEERIVHTEAEVIFYEKNIPIQSKGIVQDITESKRSEEKIKILANAVESSNDAIVTESLDGTVTSWNKGAEQIYGYSAEEIIGKNVSILEPDDIKGEIKQFSEKIKNGNEIQHYETTRLKKDGTLINISVTLSPIFDASGELVAISAIARDITKRKRAEEALRESEARLRRFYESDMFGVVYYNMDGSITDANNKFLEIIGYTREDLQAGEINWIKMTPPEYRILDEKCVAELETVGVYAPYEKEYIRNDGLRVPIILGAATFDPEHQEGIAFAIDNTERKKTEKALAEIDRIRIKEIHHRIKNNLQVISSLLDLQAEKFYEEKVREAFREGQNRVISMSLIHEELYKGKGDDTLDFSAYLRKLVENLFQTYSLNSKNIRLFLDLEKDAFFNMDTAVPLGIIVNELVSNSLKHAFTDGEKGEILIRLCREEKNNEIRKSLFSLTISDNGKGIPENIELASLESLGLQLVNILVDQLDGEIGLKGEQGTEFKITFNVVEKDNDPS